MQITSYKESLESSKETKEKKLIPSRVKTQKLKCDICISKLEEEIAAKELKVEEACQQKELDLDTIGEALDEVDLSNRRLTQFKELVTQLFPQDPI